MGALKNPRHEAYAMARFNGMSEGEAYVAAGYKQNSGNASPMNGNERILKRIEELHATKVEKTIHYATIEVLEEMHKLRRLVDLAIEEKDISTAVKAQSYIMKLFGFEDSPTLAHEMMGTRKPKHHVEPKADNTQPVQHRPFSNVIAHLDKISGTKQ